MNIDLIKTQQYLEWLKDKLYLNAISSSAKIERYIEVRYTAVILVLV